MFLTLVTPFWPKNPAIPQALKCPDVVRIPREMVDQFE